MNLKTKIKLLTAISTHREVLLTSCLNLTGSMICPSDNCSTPSTYSSTSELDVVIRMAP